MRWRWCGPLAELVERALHAQSWFAHAVQVDLGRLDAVVPHQFLDGADGRGFIGRQGGRWWYDR